ncbi:hypothetical protein BD410DRAFT_797366, partial [Rickenella mellea]
MFHQEAKHFHVLAFWDRGFECCDIVREVLNEPGRNDGRENDVPVMITTVSDSSFNTPLSLKVVWPSRRDSNLD